MKNGRVPSTINWKRKQAKENQPRAHESHSLVSGHKQLPVSWGMVAILVRLDWVGSPKGEEIQTSLQCNVLVHRIFGKSLTGKTLISQALDPKTLGLYSRRRRRLTGIGIPMINLRRSDDRLRFIMRIPILIRQRLLGEKRPWLLMTSK